MLLQYAYQDSPPHRLLRISRRKQPTQRSLVQTLSARYGIHNALEAHDRFLRLMRSHEEFEVETDRAGEWPVPFWSETVRVVVVE